MSKLWVQSLALTTAIAGFSLPSSSVLIEGAMIAKNRDSGMQISQAVQHPVLELWGKKPPHESEPVRGDGFCPIWPSTSEIVPNSEFTWDTSPTFIWMGKVTKVEVIWKRGDGRREIVLLLDRVESQPINPENEDSPKVFQYPVDAELLKPGREYAVSITYLAKINTQDGKKEVETQLDVPLTFEVIDNPEHQQIEIDLNNLQIQNPSLDREELALKRAEYFAQKGRWADVLQEFFSVSNPSADWVRATEQIGSEILQRCPTDDERNIDSASEINQESFVKRKTSTNERD